ncbi:DMT family transporter [uncultured Friedmanniella sp.]|uniref:DMT family transporter n=1 Tax=uncultured Friedmanniella sp. TaxID=335381 RepID=UPI0035CB4F5A
MDHTLAVALAALGAVLFGLAALRQQVAVLATVTGPRTGLGRLRAFWRLARQPAWLLGAAQGLAGGLAHVAALALAPITLVQPVGVLAVPVTVVASAWAAHRRPTPGQVLGSVLSVGGIAALTVLLLLPATQPVVLPRPLVLGAVVLAATVLTATAALTGGLGGPLLRCATLAAGSAVLFGLVSVLVRLAGQLISSGAVTGQLPLLTVCGLAIVVALPVGLWAMQTAYLTGSAHVVLCCLTLVDPVTAVAAGRLLLHDGVALSGPLLLAAAGCAVVASSGVVLLARAYPADASAAPRPGS